MNFLPRGQKKPKVIVLSNKTIKALAIVRADKYYVIEEKHYRMSVIDAYRYEVRLQEIDQNGELIVNESSKVNRLKMNTEKFEEVAELFSPYKK